MTTKNKPMPLVEFTPTGFYVYKEPDCFLTKEAEKQLNDFTSNRFKALYELAFLSRRKNTDKQKSNEESASFAFLRHIANLFLTALKRSSDLEIARNKINIPLDDDTATYALKSRPFALGADNITIDWLKNIWEKLNEIFAAEISDFKGDVSLYLTQKQEGLRIPERVFFHIVENKDEKYPFAFIATYSTKDNEGNVRHMPLNYALTEYSDEKEKLTSLLSCLNKAAAASDFLSQLIESGEMFHPLRLTINETYSILREIPLLEKGGIMCRVPNWWRKRSSSVKITVKIGEKKTSLAGLDSIVKIQPKLTVDGVELTQKDIKELLAATEGLSYIKGKWVEVNHERLNELLDKMEGKEGEMPLLSALRMEGGLDKSLQKDNDDNDFEYTNGKWLEDVMERLRLPQNISSFDPPKTLRANLRGYQKDGFNWLLNMANNGFGACLADDMGLGKTLQVLTFLESYRKKNPKGRILLIVPASLLANWVKEAEKFTPKLTIHILHGRKKEVLVEELNTNHDFVNITTYQMASRMEELKDIHWDGVILDEAQAIKNATAKQTKAIKALSSHIRIAMTGTPIENDLSNLWSLFDFLNRGLLGTVKEFGGFVKSLEDNPQGYERLKNMIAPFILRRVKTDKSIAPDLPDKLEQVDYIEPVKKQIVLYRKEVADLENKIYDDDLSNIKRQGLILAALTKLKQICNHPDQFLGQKTFKPEESGKFAMLKEICGTISEKRERVLVFTQYREMTEPLYKFLTTVFGQEGLVIHGNTPVKKRPLLVEKFNGEDYVPFMVLSVKAAGTGLNLTAANHVIHFDRWWNPAVENQATDRAFRIGQHKNVTVHKFVTMGTIEERIDEIISGKQELAESVIGDGTKILSQMDSEQLIKMLRFDDSVKGDG